MPARRIGTGPGPEDRSAAAAVRVPSVAPGSVALYDVDPDTVAALVLACPAVAGLSGGPSGAAATYLPGRTVPGVRISPDTVEVHVIARYGPPVDELAGQVRAALAAVVLGRPVDIVVEDLDDSPTTADGATAGTPGAADPLAVTPTQIGGVDDTVDVLAVVEVPEAAPAAPPAAPRGRWTRSGRPE